MTTRTLDELHAFLDSQAKVNRQLTESEIITIASSIQIVLWAQSNMIQQGQTNVPTLKVMDWVQAFSEFPGFSDYVKASSSIITAEAKAISAQYE